MGRLASIYVTAAVLTHSRGSLLGTKMDIKEFLRRVLGEDGFYCVFATRKSDDHPLVQKFYSSIDAVIDAAYNLDSDGFDTYFALATFKKDV